jgi:hypothetical protein
VKIQIVMKTGSGKLFVFFHVSIQFASIVLSNFSQS